MAHLLRPSSEDRSWNLPHDIWCLILRELYLDSPKSVHSISTVSKLLHSLAIRYVYRSVYVREEHLDNLESTVTAYGGTVESKLVAYTHEVIVGNAAAAELVNRLLPSFRHLEYLRWKWWKHPFPISVLEGLHQHRPRTRLCLEDLSTGSLEERWEHDAVESSLERLSHSSNVHLIDCSIRAVAAPLEHLKNFIISCRNLKILRLRQSPDSVYDVMGGSWRWSFQYEEGDVFPPLQELTIQNYRLHDYGLQSDDPYKIWDCSMLSHLELRNCQELNFLEALQELQSCIRTLILDNDFQMLSRLDRPFAHSGLMNPSLNSLVLRCIGLEHLHVSSVCGRLPLPTVAKHGSTLRSLTLRERDRWRPVATVSSPNLTAVDLDLVDASCPHLESLAVDMERSEQWDYGFLNSLSCFRRVRKICLYLEAAYSNRRFQKVGVDTASARRLFCYLHASKSGIPLHLLHLIVGEPRLYKTAGLREAASESVEREFSCSMDNAGLAIVIDSQAVAIRCEEEYFAKLRVEEEEERPAQEAAQTVARDMGSAGLEFDEVFGGVSDCAAAPGDNLFGD